jgi:hypothetical protein
MKEYIVRFTLDGEVYELKVNTASSYGAMRLIDVTYPQASNISVVNG